jgi:hypothetical protein
MTKQEETRPPVSPNPEARKKVFAELRQRMIQSSKCDQGEIDIF